jgi:molybdopterin/thiamine biosynthesis adenylyltransferase
MPEKTDLAAKSVLIAGAGNIGSHLAPLVARAGVGLLRLVDRDRVEEKNLATQDFRPEDVGRPKAEVIAGRLRERFPALRVEARACDLEDLPLGEAAVDVLLGALDSRRARQVLISEMAWPLGVPVVDGGVGEGLVGRVQVFVPGPTTACLECTWGRGDYRQLAAEYPCLPGASARAPATVSTAFLGSSVASLMASECLRLLTGEKPADSFEVPFDLGQHAMRRFLLRRSPSCRHDHETVGKTLWLLPVGQDSDPDGACQDRNPDPRGPTVGDLLAAVEGKGERVQLECRRGVGVAPGAGRFLQPETLRGREGLTLAALGFVPGDRIRVRSTIGSYFLALGG